MAAKKSPTVPSGPSGWAVFAGAILLIVGSLNMLYGLAGVINDTVITTAGHGSGVIIWNFKFWGWAHLILGGLMVAASIGLFAASNWARWLAVVFVTINAVAQIGYMTAFPLFSILIVALDVLVIYHLTVRWEEETSGV